MIRYWNLKVLLFGIMSLCMSCIGAFSNPYTSFEINYQQGLSNSAVLSICQDSQGLMWFGTYDGLNCYDGKHIEVYRTDFSRGKTLDNNIISNLQVAGEKGLWVQSFSGINLFSCDSLTVSENYSFPDEDTMVYSNEKGNSWILGSKNIYYYNTFHHRFIKAFTLDMEMGALNHCAYVDASGALNFIPVRSNRIYRYSVSSFASDSTKVHQSVSSLLLHNHPIMHSFAHQGTFIFMDDANDLYLYDVRNKSKLYIRNVGGLLQRYGRFFDIFPFYDDILITLHNGGILRLTASEQYAEEFLRADLRVFSSFVDHKQEILWLGTDGNGIVKLTKENSLVTNLIFDKLSSSINGQVRGIMTDKMGTLWVGTKGDGLIRIPSYEGREDAEGIVVYNPNTRCALEDYSRGASFFQAFMLKKQRYGEDFWVGMLDSTLYYYSYQHDRLLPVANSLRGKSVEVHDLYESKDSAVWLATNGLGLVKLRVKEENGRLRAVRNRKFRFYYHQRELLGFSSMVAQGDSVLWLGSRGQGLVRFSMKTGEYQVYSLYKILGKAVDDVLCMYPYDENRFFVGTIAGLVSIEMMENGNFHAEYIGREQGLFNDMIHGIVKDDSGILWLGTNKGLIKYDPVSKGSYTYYYSKGIEVGEFSDDSYYRCPYTGNIFLGGVNGLLYFRDTLPLSEYYADLVLRSLRIDGKWVNLTDFYSEEDSVITLDEAQNTFALQFAALDYAVPDIEYSYILEGYDSRWSLFSKENEAVCRYVPPGEYLFRVRYKKDVFDSIYKELTIKVRIIPFWYHSATFHMVLLLLGLGILAGGGYYLYRKRVFQHFIAAWALSKEAAFPGKGEVNAMPLGQWADDFPHCSTDEQVEFVRRLLEVLDEHLANDDLGSTFLSEKMHMSSRQFYRKFKELSGITPSDFIKKYKMERAAHLLAETDLSIQEVIEEVGISSRPYFYKEFSQRFGMTPKSYRDMKSSGNQ